MERVRIGQGVFGYNIPFQVFNKDGSYFVLTDYTVTLITWNPNVPGTAVVNSAGAIDVATTGKLYYTIASGDFDDIGSWIGEIKLTKSGVEIASDPFEVEVYGRP